MKKSILLIFALVALSCSSEDVIPLNDCEGTQAEINAYYDGQINWVVENSSPVDNRKIELLNQERANRLENACD